MERVERVFTIGAPAKTVFNYLNDQNNLVKLIPGAMHLEVIEHLAHGGWKFQWTRLLGKVRFEGSGECIVHIPHQYIGYVLSGGLSNELDWSLKTAAKGAEVSMHLTFGVPSPLKRRHSPQEIAEEYHAEVERIIRRMSLELETVEPTPERTHTA